MPVSRCGTRSSSISSANAAARAHLAGGAGQPGGAHVLNADDGAGLHGFEAGFEQKLFQKRIAHLHVGPLGFRGFAEFLAGHGGAVDAVAPGFRSDVNDRIAFAGGLGVENLVSPDQAQSERIHQRIAGVAGLELGLAAQVGHAKTVAVGGDAADHAFQDGMILVNVLRGWRGYGFDRRSRPATVLIGPKRSESITATGRAPMVKMSRRIPPTPVAAP